MYYLFFLFLFYLPFLFVIYFFCMYIYFRLSVTSPSIKKYSLFQKNSESRFFCFDNDPYFFF